MAGYFSNLPNIDYLDRKTNILGSYTTAKNLFKRIKIRENLAKNAFSMRKYVIVGDERPDNVAEKIYDDAELDWVILLSNNIIDVRSEWPLDQYTFDKYLIDKYGTYDQIYSIHHYETLEVRNNNNEVMLPANIVVPADFTFEYYDYELETTTVAQNFLRPVTNFDIEEKYQNDKRNINIIKPEYLTILFQDIEDLMPYKKGSQQYINDNLKRVYDVRIN